MSHARTQIRAEAVTRLTGLASTGSRVYPSRVRPLADTSLPCLLVYLDEEEMSNEIIGQPILDRVAKLKVRAVAKVSQDLDTALDQMLAEVEAAMGTGPLASVQISVPESIEVDLDDSLEKPVGIATITYRINYFTTAADPTVAL